MTTQRKYAEVSCPMCEKKRMKRTDQINKNLCRSCSAKIKWAEFEYRKKVVLSHIGRVPSEEQRKKNSESQKKRGKDAWEIPLKKAIAMHRKASGEASLKWLYASYKRSAKLRGIEFNLTLDSFASVTKRNCIYCGTVPSNQIEDHKKRLNGAYVFNGIDRVDSNLGYIESNVVACCKTCNYAKRKMTTQEFIDWVNSVFRHFHYPIDTMGSRDWGSK